MHTVKVKGGIYNMNSKQICERKIYTVKNDERNEYTR